MCLMVSGFVLSFSPQDVLDEIWDWIWSVSEDFSYLLIHNGFLFLVIKMLSVDDSYVSNSPMSTSGSLTKQVL